MRVQSMNRVYVPCNFYYSLVYNAHYNLLENYIYEVDFLEYIKAGIAYNTRASENSSRKVSDFVNIYRILQSGDIENNITIIRKFMHYFYEDLLVLYEKHIKASFDYDLIRGRKREHEKNITYPVIVPVYKSIPSIVNIGSKIICNLCGNDTQKVTTYAGTNIAKMDLFEDKLNVNTNKDIHKIKQNIISDLALQLVNKDTSMYEAMYYLALAVENEGVLIYEY